MNDPNPGGGAATIRVATAADLVAIETLLATAELPLAGVAAALLLVADSDGDPRAATTAGDIAGVAGLEIHDGDGILRSVAVDAAARGRGLGARLVESIIAEGRGRGLRRLYLLTTTAERWFPSFGFRRIDRSEVAAAVLESVEFSEACPASAVAMVLDLDGPGGRDR